MVHQFVVGGGWRCGTAQSADPTGLGTWNPFAVECPACIAPPSAPPLLSVSFARFEEESRKRQELSDLWDDAAAALGMPPTADARAVLAELRRRLAAQ